MEDRVIALHGEQAHFFGEKDDFDEEEYAYDATYDGQGEVKIQDDLVHSERDDAHSDHVESISVLDSSMHWSEQYEDSKDCGFDSSLRVDNEDDQRLLGAFLLAVDGGLERGGALGMGEGNDDNGDVLQLKTDGPTCLKQFTIIAASLGLKTTREQLREDFEGIVRTNGLVENDPAQPWRGAYDPSGVVRGFTFEVFKQYYHAKVQGMLPESDIRQAWDDLHYGTGSKRMSIAEGQGEGTQLERPYVTRAELLKMLTREGEALTDEEVHELLRECRPDEEGRIVYEGYRRMLMDPSI